MSLVGTTWLSRIRQRCGRSVDRPAAARQRCRPRFDVLEDRIVPAFNLAIDTALTMNVSTTLGPTTTTFTANASGATLNVGDILLQLQAGKDVVVDTGAAGAELGNITWTVAADLDFNNLMGSRSLRLQTNNTIAATGGISVAADIFDSNTGSSDVLALVLNSSATNGAVAVSGLLANLSSVTINAGTGNVATGSVASPDGAISFTGGLITLNGNLIANDVNITGNVLLTTDVAINVTFIDVDFDGHHDGDVNITGTLNGTSADDLHIEGEIDTVTLGGIVGAGGQIDALVISAGTTNLSKNLTAGTLTIAGEVNINANMAITTSVGNVDFSSGTVTMNANLAVNLPGVANVVHLDNGILDVNVKALTVSTGALALFGSGTLSGTGTVIADVQVHDGGAISPGGAGVGTLIVTGNVDFQGMMGSFFKVNIIGATSDRLDVTGTVALGSMTSLEVTGSLNNGAVVTLIDATMLTGTFQAGGGVYLLGNEAVTTNYSTTTLTLLQAPAQPGKTFTGLTPGGDLFKIQLLGTGPGQLVIVNGGNQIVVRNGSASNTLQITVTPNGGPGTVNISTIIVQTGIGAITGATANVSGGVTVNGVLGSMTLRDLQGTSSLGGTNTNKTKIVTRFLNGTLTSSGRIASLTALRIVTANISATTIGNLTVKASPTLGTPGDISNTTVTVSGFSGIGKLGLGAVNVAGTVLNTTFNVLAGNVGSFITKKFVSSNLYVGFTPPSMDFFTDPGTWGPMNFKVNTFKTTAVVFPSAAAPDPSTLSFFDSEVVAAKLGTVRLGAVEIANGGTAFGLKVRAGVAGNVGSVGVAAPTPTFNPATNLLPGFAATDFLFLQQP